ncbi:MAG: hypothetical protein NC304_05880 [Robinsoniella sp.]|nr:hypothetical protein [Robinsoniella sp.]
MSSKFTVIESANEDKLQEMDRIKKVVKLNEIWQRQYRNSLLQAAQKNKDIKSIADYPQADIMKIALSGIKYICSWRDVKRENSKLGIEEQHILEESQATFQLIDAIFTVCGCLTLRNFVTTFPIDKTYDGAKWECKDYFSTMEVLSKMDWDKPIGKDELLELLWDYDNSDLRHAYVEFTTAMSAIYRAQTGKGIAETWCEDMEIPTYTVYKDTGIMKNNQTGDIMKPKKASHLHIVK